MIPHHPDHRCRNCKWWDQRLEVFLKPTMTLKTIATGEKETVELGLCKRYAPNTGAGFSSTREDDWCGDFETSVT